MILVKLMGGLGNQMFQYAAGRALASIHKCELKLDLSFLQQDNVEAYTKRNFELSIFQFHAGIASAKEIKDFTIWEENSRYERIGKLFPFLVSKKIVREPHFQFYEGFPKLSKNSYLIGYWQSEKYFKGIEKTIQNDFQFKQSTDAQNANCAAQITAQEAISIHIRRGDYVSNKDTAKHHPVCSIAYYEEAIKYISQRVSNPHFYIFSDDYQWAKSNLRLDFPHEFIDYNKGVSSYEDMRLMSLCKHNIIANSSFSWWGAWLNNNPNKVIIHPKKWFNDETINTKDLCSDKWIPL